MVETDASNKGIRAVLMQKNHPIAFLSRALGTRHQGLSTYEKESLAIMLAVEHWHPYLQHAEFFIRQIIGVYLFWMINGLPPHGSIRL